MRSHRQPLIYAVLTLVCTAILVLFTDVESDLERQLKCSAPGSFAGADSDTCIEKYRCIAKQ